MRKCKFALEFLKFCPIIGKEHSQIKCAGWKCGLFIEKPVCTNALLFIQDVLGSEIMYAKFIKLI